jgi:hypothetical protein
MVVAMADLDELAQRFRDFARTSTSRAPLYGRLADGIADDPELLALLLAAPTPQQLPVLLLAAVHDLVLRGDGPQLRRHYPNLSEAATAGDPLPDFTAFCAEHREQLLDLISTRTTQTNEVGRCAQFLPVMGLLGDEVGPIAHIDVGSSAGLNLLLSRFEYRYDPGGTVGGPSTVVLECATRGPIPIPAELPLLAMSVGLDISPIDIFDDEEVRWLEACMWPDQADRFARLVAALTLARSHPPDVRRGDAVRELSALITEAAMLGHPVVTNSWVLNYLTARQRLAYVHELDEIGARMDLSWIIAESPAQTPELPVPTTSPAEDITVVSMVTWRAGRRTVRRLGTSHPHGFWLHWETA